jgi:hypothetical protein
MDMLLSNFAFKFNLHHYSEGMNHAYDKMLQLAGLDTAKVGSDGNFPWNCL